MNYLKRIFVLLLLQTAVTVASAQQKVPATRYQPVSNGNFVQSKNYYLLTLFSRVPEVKALLERDTLFNRFTKEKQRSLSASLTECKDVSCFIERMKFSDAEIGAVSNRLKTLYSSNNALGRLVTAHIIPSNKYILLKKESGVEYLVSAWEQDAAGVNYTIDVYGAGRKPNYPGIDSISFNVKDKNYLSLLRDCEVVVADETKNSRSFFAAPLQSALQLLEINERNDAANNEPMAFSDNKAAVLKAKTVNWAKYPYTLILAPGAGPEEAGVALSAEGMLRCRLAVQRYREGMAPFIVVSGGNVHPYKTKYNEAVEMKKFIINTLHIPESAVIIDPHARHTTTNMRNCARLIYAYNMPFDKPAIVSTTKYQSDYIMDMDKRCRDELHYVPYKLGKRLGETVIEFYPAIEAWQINPYEPLDP